MGNTGSLGVAAEPPGHAADRDELREARRLVADLLRHQPRRYWLDFAAATAAAWAAFAAAVAAPPWSGAMWAWLAAAAVCWYRTSMFIHELAHLRRSQMPAFRAAWNTFVGIPLFLPSALYEGVHHGHHRKATYGTVRDPEYVALAGRRGAIAGFAAAGAFLPLLLAARFLILVPATACWPRARRFVEERVSSFCINPWYVRTPTESERWRLRFWDAATCGAWGLALAACAAGQWPARAFALWALAYGAVALANQARTLVAHRYESAWQSMDHVQQLRDSIDNPGRWWTELWAPLGIRYHALHHLLPNLPYHNMPEAYRRLTAALPANGVSRSVRSPGFAASFAALWRRRT